MYTLHSIFNNPLWLSRESFLPIFLYFFYEMYKTCLDLFQYNSINSVVRIKYFYKKNYFVDTKLRCFFNKEKK